MSTYRFRSRPYDHQKQAVRFALRRFAAGRNVALFMEPRTGKTFTTINVVGAMHTKDPSTMARVLIVCPARVIGVWVDEIAKFFPGDCLVTVRDAKGRKKPIPETLAPVHFVVTNYEAFSTPGKKLPSGRRSQTSGRAKERDTILAWAPDMIVLDESHKIKTASSKAATMLVRMATHIRYRMILTGTPVTKANRVHDLFMQWKFLNPDQLIHKRYDEFRQATGVWVDAGGFPVWRGPREEGIQRAREMIAPDSVIVRRSDCFDLPPRETIVKRVKLSPDTAAAYDSMAQDMVAALRNGAIAEASIPLVVTLRLLQMTSGFVTTPDKINHQIGTEKLDALREYLTEDLDGQKCVVAARFQYDLDRIQELCDELRLPWWSVRGGRTLAETDTAIKQFRTSDDGVMIIQPAAAALGIDLSTARHMVWYSLTYSYVDFSQAEDRIALSKEPTTYCYLLADQTVDELVHKVLQTDGEVARAIMEQPERILR